MIVVATKNKVLQPSWALPIDLKHNGFFIISTDSLSLRVAQMPRSRDLMIFLRIDRQTDRWTDKQTDCLTPCCACVRRVTTLVHVACPQYHGLRLQFWQSNHIIMCPYYTMIISIHPNNWVVPVCDFSSLIHYPLSSILLYSSIYLAASIVAVLLFCCPTRCT